MSLLQRLFGKENDQSAFVEPEIAAAIHRWRGRAATDLTQPIATQPWLVVDVETTGLDMRRDQLLAIGAVVMEPDAIQFQHTFEIVLKQDVPSRIDNILVHRIGGGEQLAGSAPAAALAAFLDFAGDMPCIAFHADFDEAMLRRAYRQYLDIDFAPRFIDLAFLAPALVNDAPKNLRSLDDWIDYFSITIFARHCAVADALGTAQLFLALRARAGSVRTAEQLFALARDQRWLNTLSRR